MKGVKAWVITAATFTIALSMWPSCANAFWSRANFQIHQQITDEALDDDQAFTFQGVSYIFSDKAIAAINSQHKFLDMSAFYDPRDHFDSEHLVDGFTQLRNSRLAMETVSLKAPDSDVLWMELGMMLHQIQDYYSHSTYISSGLSLADHSKIQDFGSLTDPDIAATIPVWFSSKAYSSDNGADCDRDFITLLPNVFNSQLLTTGYYQAQNPATGKCNHGLYGETLGTSNLVIAGGKCTIGIKTPADGIARDHPCSSKSVEVTEFDWAKKLATKETKQFVKAITDKLDRAGNSAGFCKLLGLDSSSPPCQSLPPPPPPPQVDNEPLPDPNDPTGPINVQYEMTSTTSKTGRACDASDYGGYHVSVCRSRNSSIWHFVGNGFLSFPSNIVPNQTTDGGLFSSPSLKITYSGYISLGGAGGTYDRVDSPDSNPPSCSTHVTWASEAAHTFYPRDVGYDWVSCGF